MKTTTILVFMCLSVVSFASGGEHGASHAESEIPLQTIGWQAANLGILVVALFFFIRKSIIEAFENRQKNYLERAEKTKAALKDAEATLAEIKQKLSTLESGEKKSLESARVEAKNITATMLKEAEAAAEKIKKDATFFISNELGKAKAEINNTILIQALAVASKNLTTKSQTASAAQEASFVKQLEQVKS